MAGCGLERQRGRVSEVEGGKGKRTEAAESVEKTVSCLFLQCLDAYIRIEIHLSFVDSIGTSNYSTLYLSLVYGSLKCISLILASVAIAI